MCFFFFFFKQKTAYEIGTGDWSSDVCSDLVFSNKIFSSFIVMPEHVWAGQTPATFAFNPPIGTDRKSVV